MSNARCSSGNHAPDAPARAHWRIRGTVLCTTCLFHAASRVYLERDQVTEIATRRNIRLGRLRDRLAAQEHRMREQAMFKKRYGTKPMDVDHTVTVSDHASTAPAEVATPTNEST